MTIIGGMLLIGIVNVILGFWSYTAPSEIHERIIPNVPYAYSTTGSTALAPEAASGCAPEIVARVAARIPDATIVECTAQRVLVMRGDHRVELEVAGNEIRGVTETLAISEIPAAVMRAFAVAYPRTIPSSAIRRSRLGADPIYDLRFPAGAAHRLATLGADGTVIEIR
jgi:hypothetical protein